MFDVVARNGHDEMGALAAILEERSEEPLPPDTKGLLYKLFEGLQFVEHSLGKLAGEVGRLSGDVRDLKARFRDSRKKLDTITGELEDTKSMELRELRAERRKFFWLVFGAVVTAVTGGMAGALLHSIGHK